MVESRTWRVGEAKAAPRSVREEATRIVEVNILRYTSQ